MKRLFLALPLLLVITACGQVSAPADPSAIKVGAEAWQAALNAKNIDGLVALYTEDARLMPPNAEMTTGHEAIRATFGGMIDAGIGIELVTVEAAASGDKGHRVGTYKLMSDGAVVDAGKYIETWERGADGQWHIANDIWNSDNPPAPPMKHKMHEGGGMMSMPHVMILHEVEDGAHWLEAWSGEDSRRNMFMANGVANLHTFQSADNPNLTGVVLAVKDMEAFHAMLQSEEGKAAAAEDGVDLENMTVLMEAK